MDVEIDEGERQMLLLAAAELSLRRPGWEYALRELSKKLGGNGESMFYGFRRTSALHPHPGLVAEAPLADGVSAAALPCAVCGAPVITPIDCEPRCTECG